MGTGSVFGLVKWNLNRWFAIAARPELIRWTVYNCGTFGDAPCTSAVQSRMRWSLGVEAGGVPGAVLTGVGGGVLLLASTLFLLTYHGSN